MTTANSVELHADPIAFQAIAMLDRVQQQIETGRVKPALETLFDELSIVRSRMDPEEWTQFSRYARESHEVAGAILQDPMTRRACEKPRGYAGDAVMMDYLYRLHSAGSAEAASTETGQAVFRHIQQRPAGQAVRFRRVHIASLIDECAARSHSARVLSVASGHLREAELSRALAMGKLGEYVALDADAESLREVSERYGTLGVRTVHGSVRQLLTRKIDLGLFDFVYAAGLYDYLNDAVAAELTSRLFDLTKPGGVLLIPNFAKDIADLAYMETFMDWNLIYRDKADMGALMSRIEPSQIASHEIYSSPEGSVLYLVIRRA